MTKKMDAFTKRAWRTAAIYRCCLNRGMDKDWAMEKIREIAPDGTRDHLVELWFVDMDRLRERIQARTESPSLFDVEYAPELRMVA